MFPIAWVWVLSILVTLAVFGLVISRYLGLTLADARERVADTAADFRDWIRLGR